MRPKNFTDRKKRILTFGGLYAASVILLFFIFSAFGVHFSASDHKAGSLPANGWQTATSDNEILQADSLLHAKLGQLQQSDEQLAILSADTASALKNSSSAALVSFYEAGFQKALDSIDNISAAFSGAKADMFRTVVGSFKSILNNRLTAKTLHGPASIGKIPASVTQSDITQLRKELVQKDNDLARQDALIKALQVKSFSPLKTAGADEAQKGETDLLKMAFDNKQKDYDVLKDNYTRLKADNNSLALQITEYKKMASSQAEDTKASTENKINALQEKVQGLNADLYFAKIDCNLTRADAQQIISNARQRKELLSESLAMLNTLAASGDAGVQKKAREKIVHLNQIATALHD